MLVTFDQKVAILSVGEVVIREICSDCSELSESDHKVFFCILVYEEDSPGDYDLIIKPINLHVLQSPAFNKSLPDDGFQPFR